MKVFQTLHMGQHHNLHCEDYLLHATIGTQRQLFAVMDGCTMGRDSHFAATLCGKALKKIALERGYLEFKAGVQLDLNLELKAIVQRLFQELKSIKNQLLLDQYDLLNTLILLLWDEDQVVGQVIVIGDGVVCHDGRLHVFDQNNQPDYLGYYLDEDFETWFVQQKQHIVIQDFQDLSISSDGILSFAPFDDGEYPLALDPVYFLLEDAQFVENENMLDKKVRILEKQHGLKPMDDLAIIRLVKE